MIKIAVVILNWNGEVLLERYLGSVVAFSKGADVYMVDNASTDASIAYVAKNFPSVQIIRNSENGGFAKGYNDGLRNIQADVYCLLNSDVEVVEDWLKPIRTLFEEHPDAAIAQPKILDLLNRDRFEYAGAAGGFLDQLGYPFCRGRIFQALEKDSGQYNDVRTIFWATGACMFIKSHVFWELGGFDEDYFAHQEEVDLCWRAHNHGYKVYYCGFSKVYHLGGSTLSNMNPRKTFLNFRNTLYSITKNLPRRKAFLLIFIRLLLDGVAGIRFVLQFRWPHCWAIVRAHWSFYAHFPKMYRKRERTRHRNDYFAVKSIVWEYYIKGVRKFNILVKD